MNKFEQTIESIVESKIIPAAFGRQCPRPTYEKLMNKQREMLILQLIEDDEEVSEFIAAKINSAFAESYHNQTRDAEAEDDAADMKRFIEEDAAERARDMNLDRANYYQSPV